MAFPVCCTSHARVYVQFQGKYEEAQRLYERSLAMAENAHGLHHFDVATCLDNLTGLLIKQVSPNIIV